MRKGISNFEIKRVFKEINNDDLNKNFLNVFPSDKINKFVMFERMIPGKKHPFIISNIDRSDKNGMQWWSILNISPKSEHLFFPDNDSKIHDYKKLTNEALDTLLNEFYNLDQEQNEETINEYMKQ